MTGSATSSTRGPGDDNTALLAALGVAPGAIYADQPLAGSISGTAVRRLLLERAVAPEAASYVASRVYKRVAPEGGWLSAASHDTVLRELRLHSTGLLADLPAMLATGVVGWTERGPSTAPVDGALLLADERGHLLPYPVQTPSGRHPAIVSAILTALARLHARYWDDPRLGDAALGLTSTRDALLLTAPATLTARMAAGDANPYLVAARTGWDAFFHLADSRNSAILRGVFAGATPYIAAIDTLPRTLVHGDIWGPNLGLLPPARQAPRHGRRLLLLDWALATAGPCTYDPLWLCGTWHALDPVRVLAAYRAALSRALAMHGKRLSAATWRALADAGYLRTVLTCGEALGRAANEAPPGQARVRARKRVRWWAHRAGLAAGRLASPVQ